MSQNYNNSLIYLLNDNFNYNILILNKIWKYIENQKCFFKDKNLIKKIIFQYTKVAKSCTHAQVYWVYI